MPTKIALSEIASVRNAIVETFVEALHLVDALRPILAAVEGAQNSWLELPAGKYRDSAYTLVSRWNAQGLIADLIGGLHHIAPHSEALQRLVRLRLAMAPAISETTELQGFVQAGINYLPAGGWIESLRHRMRAVCRIDLVGFEPPGIGTGFLISPDRVVTAHHVVERIIKQPLLAETVVCRFGCLNDTDQGGHPFRLRRPQWIEIQSLPGAVELSHGGAEPGRDQLDFALLRLRTKMVDIEPFKPAANPPETDHPVIVLQHPRRAPLAISLGRIIGYNLAGTRLRHSAATERGSSGAPCLNLDLDLIGLHNAARYTASEGLAAYNTAVPFELIMTALAGKVLTLAAPGS